MVWWINMLCRQNTQAAFMPDHSWLLLLRFFSHSLKQNNACKDIIHWAHTLCSHFAILSSDNKLASFFATMWALRTVTSVKIVNNQPTEPSPTELQWPHSVSLPHQLHLLTLTGGRLQSRDGSLCWRQTNTPVSCLQELQILTKE